MRVVVIGGWAPSLLNFRGQFLAAMVAKGHDVTAMAADGSEEVRAGLAGLGVRFEDLLLERAGVNPAADLRTVIALVRRFRALQPQVVFAYTIKPVIYGLLAAKLARIPIRAAMITGLGYSFGEARSPGQRVVRAVARGLYRSALARSHVVFFQNQDDRDEFMRRGLLSPRSRIELVRGSGVDLDFYPATPLPPGPPTFLFIGRLLRDKGIHEYVEAARRVRRNRPDARFRIVGGIDPNPESVAAADLERWGKEGIVEYVGALEDVRPEIGGCHAIVLPSYREGTPRVVLEAMSMGRAVITTDVPGCRDTINDDEQGILIPPRDVDALVGALLRLIDQPALLSRYAAAARPRAEAVYDGRQVAQRMLTALGL